MNRVRQLFLATSLVATGAMAESVSFIAIGDMGTGGDKQYKVASAIETLPAKSLRFCHWSWR